MTDQQPPNSNTHPPAESSAEPAESSKRPADEHAVPPKGPSRASANAGGAGGGGKGLTWAAVALAVLALLASLYLWLVGGERMGALSAADERQQASVTQTEQTLRGDLQQIEERQKQVEQRQRDVEKRQQGVDQRQAEFNQAVEGLHELIGRERTDWVSAEAEYLVQIAAHRLQIARDVESALAALRLADARLRELSDPVLLPVRGALAREIAALEAVDQPDIAGMALALDGVLEQVPKLHLKSAHPPRAELGGGADQVDPQASEEVWRQALDRAVGELRSLVVIRRRDQPIEPMISPARERELREILRLRMESARAALIRQDTTLFQRSLEDAKQWLQRHFDADDPALSSLQSTLAELQQSELQPELPDIDDSLRQLRRVRADNQARAGGGPQS